MWTKKDTGYSLTALGSMFEEYGVVSASESMTQINQSNVESRMADVKQLTKSMSDNVKTLIRGSRRASGKLKLAVAASNLVMEGSPLMAAEELYQRGSEDVKAVQEKARFQFAGIQKRIEMDYMKTISELKGQQTAAIGRTISTIGGYYGGK